MLQDGCSERWREVQHLQQTGYRPQDYVDANPQLQRVLQAMADGTFSGGNAQTFQPLVESLLQRDQYLLMADFAAYAQTQLQVDALYDKPTAWSERAILNVAGMGSFSSDRTIREYISSVWAQQGA